MGSESSRLRDVTPQSLSWRLRDPRTDAPRSALALEAIAEEFRAHFPPGPPRRPLKLMPMSPRPPLPLDLLDVPDVLGLFPGPMADFRQAAGHPVDVLVPGCSEGVVLVGTNLLAFGYMGCVLVGTLSAVGRWLGLRGDALCVGDPD